jgi:RNA polymerase sigma factor (sigma-70 family)
MTSRCAPPVLERLLQARSGPPLERAWTEFLQEYSRLILHVARSFGGSYDAVMDRYAYVLERLRHDDFRRLRGYVADGRGKFTTWLVVVIRRLCLDQTRARYGRRRTAGADAVQERRRLADLVAAEVDAELLPGADSSPENLARASQLNGNLASAISRLDPDDRLLLRLRFNDEIPVTEIARIGSFPTVFHVYRRLNGIFEELRRMLHEAGVRDAAP